MPLLDRNPFPHAGDSESGQSLIEFALCLPILLLIVFGIAMFGLTFANYLMLTDATNVGARQLAVSRGQTSDPCATVSSSVIAGTPNLLRNSLVFNYTINGSAYNGTSCTGAASNMVQGSTARVVVTYPCSLVSFRYNYSPSCTISASTAELIQ